MSKYRKDFTYEGKRYTIRADSERELYEKMALKKRDLEEGRVLVSQNMLVRDWATMCVETYKTNQKEVTKKSYNSRVKKITDAFGNMRLKDVHPIHCQNILNEYEGMSKRSINEAAQIMKFIFEKARENKLIYENPAAALSKPSGTFTERRAVTDYERKHILKVCYADRAYTLFLLMLHCGCRPSEAIHAIGKDICTIDNTHILCIRGTKTENAVRKVPICDDLYKIIKDTEPFSPISPNRAGHFHTESSYARLREHFYRDLNISMGCKLYRNALVPPLPLAEDFVPYDLRHTYCTDLQKAGIDIRTAQYLMGHSDISLTANIYTHVDDSIVLKAAESMRKLI